MKPFTRTRLVAGVLLGSRAAAAAYTHRHQSVVRRYVQPVACDVRTRAALYDLDESVRLLGVLDRRVA